MEENVRNTFADSGSFAFDQRPECTAAVKCSGAVQSRCSFSCCADIGRKRLGMAKNGKKATL